MNIPKVPFHAHVTGYFDPKFQPPTNANALSGESGLMGRTPDEVIVVLKDLAGKFKSLEANLQEKLARLAQKRDQVEANLNVLGVLEGSQGSMPIEYELGPGMFARASIKDCGKVQLWIGANTLAEYTVDDAKLFLERKLAETKESERELKADLSKVRDQITACEVTIARVYNHIVQQRRAASGPSSK